MSDLIEALEVIGLVVGLLAAFFLLPLAGKMAAAKFMPSGRLKSALLKEDEEIPTSPSSERSEWRSLFLWLAFMLGLFGLAFLDDRSRNVSSLSAPFLVAYVLGLLWLVRSFIAWRRASDRILSQEELTAFQGRLHAHWFSRYSIATVLLCGALFIPEAKPKFWWLSIFLALWAAVLARELSLLLLAAAGLYFVFKGLASVPVSVAIVIGACIIAYAIQKRGKRGG